MRDYRVFPYKTDRTNKENSIRQNKTFQSSGLVNLKVKMCCAVYSDVSRIDNIKSLVF